MINDQKNTSKYMHIVQFVKDRVTGGDLKISDQVPSENELIETFNVSSITVRKAMEKLAAEGVVYRVKGKGTFVATPQSADTEPDKPSKIYLILDMDGMDTSLNKILHGIQSYLNGRGYLLILENQAFCGEFLNCETDIGKTGLIVFMNPDSNKQEPDIFYQLYKEGVNFVCIDRYIGNYPVNYVGTNNHDAVYTAAEYLLGLGHRHIGFLSYTPEVSSERERYSGYRDSLSDNGLADFIMMPRDVSSLDSYIIDLRNGENTAVICANDITASMLIERLKSAGLRVPEDISVVGFDDMALFKYHQPALTTLRQDFEAIGYEAAKSLVKLMTGAVSGYKKVYLPAKLIVRDSTRQIL